MGKLSEPDVAVIGGGVLGLCSAYHCARAGLRVIVVDQGALGGRASGGIVGAMAPHTPDEWNLKKQFQYEALTGAADFWGQVDHLSGLSSGFGRIGRLVPIVSPRGLELAQSRTQSAPLHWAAQYDWQVLPDHPLVRIEKAPFGVIHETLSARIYPKLACASLVGALKSLGVELVEDRRVTHVETGRVVTDQGPIEARNIVVAAGYDGFKILQDIAGQECGSGVKGQAALLDINLPNTPQIHGDGVYIVPHASGGVAIGSTSEKLWNGDRTVDAQLDQVVALAREICPAIAEARVLQRWAEVRPKAVRRNPMLGAWPDLDRVFVAMGGFKIGFSIANKVGALTAQAVQGDTSNVPRSFTVEHHLMRK